ncbi:phosphoketolase family protein [Frondihabitans australicus]|uniref:Xylulose-5-phosphate/fructose-6-phosphate phosphoketolase n=1 Tax=Frondihabitans australicus TaxID=386892 RepID=A0A495IHT1_9MICO|nr:phosphoketolase family protein [Frondihabitans australicus]RKR74871.1 xylulose-5-phosphate/fructose-6-phosphate phosphoketolase [Frondihabitans australicus]
MNENASAAPAPDLTSVDSWWRAANYLTVGQIYLMDDPLLQGDLTPAQIKPRLLGHWGTSPALNLVYAHLNRVIVRDERQLIYVCGPGHGGPAMVANAWLDGTYSELVPDVTRDRAGMQRLFEQFSFPGGIPSHDAPNVPGSINEGGELGYSLSHAYGAVLDNPDLVAVCVVGDGEAETGPLAASWHANKLIDAAHDGAVLPILNLNGYKIANPTILARIDESELLSLFRGYGYAPIVVAGGYDGEDPMKVHERMAAALDDAFTAIDAAQEQARTSTPEAAGTDMSAAGQSDGPHDAARPAWPMIILRTPKGWTGPKEVDGLPVENTWRAHQVPLPNVREDPAHLEQLAEWMKSYRPHELFGDDGLPASALATLKPHGDARMSATPFANGGRLRTDLRLSDFRAHAVDTAGSRTLTASATHAFGEWLADIVTMNPETFRLFGPDETVSNKLESVFGVTDRAWAAHILASDENLAHSGRVTEVLSEHLLQGMLEGYLLTGRHGVLNTYEAFVHIVDSMFNQHAKWLEATRDIEWRRPISSFVYLLSSHVWRQDHNGFSHQDPGFLDVVVNKQAHLVRISLAPDANTLLAVMDKALRDVDTVQVIVAGKQDQPAWLSMHEAEEHVLRGAGEWAWAGTPGLPDRDDDQPDIVLACAGDVPTLETVAAADIIRREFPEVAVRVVNVVDLMKLQDQREHPNGLTDDQFDALFTVDRPVLFDFHGYPSLVHQLTYRRHNHDNLHVRGFREKGTTTTPFDMAMLNDIDRYKLVLDVLKYVPGLSSAHPDAVADFTQRRVDAREWSYTRGEDHPDVTGWQFSG